MSLVFADNLSIQMKKQNVDRDSFSTLEEMRNYPSTSLPDIFTATCKETGKFYIYNEDNEFDEELGKWRVIEGDNSDNANLQPKSDNSLNTKDKTVAGAINELQSDVSTLNSSSHSHDNKELLDKFSESDGKLTYDGSYVIKDDPDLSSYQLKSDSTLTTTNQTVVGAINELASLENVNKNDIDTLKGEGEGSVIQIARSELTRILDGA